MFGQRGGSLSCAQCGDQGDCQVQAGKKGVRRCDVLLLFTCLDYVTVILLFGELIHIFVRKGLSFLFEVHSPHTGLSII